MWRNYLAAGLRNLARNRLHSAITTLSLALGFAAVILATVFWRFEHSYDRHWPDQERIYAVGQWVVPKEGPAIWADTTPSTLARQIEQAAPGIEQLTRRLPESMRVMTPKAEAVEAAVNWVDLNFFDIFKAKAIAGSLNGALKPGYIVITRAMADKYFGRTNVVGETMRLTRTGAIKEVMAMRVAAVIENLPANTHFTGGILVAVRDRSRIDNIVQNAFTYVKVRPGVNETSLTSALKSLSQRLPPLTRGLDDGQPDLRATPLRYFYLPPKEYRSDRVNMAMTHGNDEQSRSLVGLALLILAIAAINFVTLMTARGARRAVEVGVRKASGARRRDLVIQFVGEGLIYTALALIIAFAMTEFLLPLMVKATGRPVVFDYAAELPFIGVLLLGAAAVGILAGLYPALALSAFRPASVLKGGLAKTPGSARLRQILIGLQFTPLLLLAVGAVVVGLEGRTVFQNSLKMMPPEMLIIRTPCTPALRQAFGAVAGVASVNCAEMNGDHMNGKQGSAPIIGVMTDGRVITDGKRAEVFMSLTDREGLEFYGLAPVAGRLWTGPEDERGVVINEDAAKKLGFKTLAAAIGQTIEAKRKGDAPMTLWPVIGVVNNRGGVAGFEAGVYLPVLPSEREGPIFGLRLRPDADAKATLAALDKAYAATGARQPLRREFYRDRLSSELAGMNRFFRFLLGAVGVGMVIATVGLFGVAAFIAEQRTKEIGVRKALGADRRRLLQMLVFQFSKPVIIANVVAIPLVFAYFAYSQREVEVAERTHLNPAVFIPVIVGSLLVAFLATFGHAWQVTGAKPVTALRYE